ncbi:hypothetical protein DPMN_078552 [Dreissena polymorpha]|uniref:Uncharacterized protein n=1 Tax=Dreissena polymorpha TaxID=45954 RepID=A0A9D3YMF5_DREPO|nr:hypothetical protein DPMN_078552 [Dreissena polymorpha]
MMKGAVVEWKCSECSRPAEVVLEVQMEKVDMAEESELTAEVPPEVLMETADIAVESELAVPEISEIQDTSYMSELLGDTRRDEDEDRSFNITGQNIEAPIVPLDRSILEWPLDDVIPEDRPVTYVVISGGSKRGGNKLISSDGYYILQAFSALCHGSEIRPHSQCKSGCSFPN